jgi:uncharacterized protein YkwD
MMRNKRDPLLTRFIRLALVSVFSLIPFWINPQPPVPALASEAADPQNSVFLPLTWNRLPEDAPPESTEDWLGYLNFYRSLAKLPPVNENESWGIGGWYHSRYMVYNDFIGHEEDPSNSWYSSEGDLAAQSSNLVVTNSASTNDNYAIDSWMQAPFHALHILNPSLEQVGYGSFRAGDGGVQMGATLDVMRGLGGLPTSVEFPVLWPANGMTVPIGTHTGEYPNPLASCPGYTAPAGLPILLQLGQGEVVPQVTGHSFKEGNKNLEHCVFDETNYANDSIMVEGLGQNILDSHDAVVLIPRQPLTPGLSYTVSITTNGQTYTWSFEVAAQTFQPELFTEAAKAQFSVP